jgi:hypothetical protein
MERTHAKIIKIFCLYILYSWHLEDLRGVLYQ